MLKQLIDSGRPRDIVVLYGCGSAAEVAYGDVLDEAAERQARAPILRSSIRLERRPT